MLLVRLAIKREQLVNYNVGIYTICYLSVRDFEIVYMMLHTRQPERLSDNRVISSRFTEFLRVIVTVRPTNPWRQPSSPSETVSENKKERLTCDPHNRKHSINIWLDISVSKIKVSSFHEESLTNAEINHQGAFSKSVVNFVRTYRNLINF